MDPKSWKHRVHCTGVGRITGWRVSFFRRLRSEDLSSRLLACSLPLPPRWLGLSDSLILAVFTVHIPLGREGTSEFGQFWELSEAILSCCFPILRSFPEVFHCPLDDHPVVLVPCKKLVSRRFPPIRKILFSEEMATQTNQEMEFENLVSR